jgi:hypothetical protein
LNLFQKIQALRVTLNPSVSKCLIINVSKVDATLSFFKPIASVKSWATIKRTKLALHKRVLSNTTNTPNSSQIRVSKSIQIGPKL